MRARYFIEVLSPARRAHAGAPRACPPVKRADWRWTQVCGAARAHPQQGKERQGDVPSAGRGVCEGTAGAACASLLSAPCAPSVVPAPAQGRRLGCAQGVLQQLMESGTVSKLPEDLQWSIRLLVPRRAAAAAAPTPALATPALSAAALPAQAEAPALTAPGVAVGQGVGSVIAQQAGRPCWPCCTCIALLCGGD